jgi:hypothetical protein
VAELALALDMAVGIDASRRPIERSALVAVSDATRRAPASRAERVGSWDELLRT